MIETQCAACGKRYQVGNERAGMKFRCRECDAIVRIPRGAPSSFDDDFDEYDDGYDDDYRAPRPARRARNRRPPKKRPGSNAGVIVGAAVGGVVVLGGIVTGIVLFLNSSNDRSSANSAGSGGSNVSGLSPGGVPSSYGSNRTPAVGNSDAYRRNDEFYDKVSKGIQDMGKAMNSIRDPQTARSAATRLNQVAAVLEQQANIAPSLPKISFGERNRIKQKYESRLVGLGYSTGYRAGRASRGEPTFMAAVKRCQNAIKRLEPYVN